MTNILGLTLAAILAIPTASWSRDLDGLSPVAFTQFRSSMPDAKAAVIAESLSGHLGRTFVDVYATEMIGVHSAFAPKLPPAVLGSSGYALGEMDRTIDLNVMPEIRPTLATLDEDEQIVLTIEVLWADQATAERLPETSFLASALVAAMKLSGHVDAASLLSLKWVDIDSSDRSGALRASLRRTQMLQRLAKAKPGQWLPWDTAVKIVVGRDGIQLQHASLLVPSAFSKNETLNRPGMTITRVSYAPLMDGGSSTAAMDLARVSFNRHYAAATQPKPSELRLSFGTWNGKSFQTCEAKDCLAFANRVPTIHGRVVFSQTSWWGSLVAWFRSWVVSEISTEIMLKDLSLTYDRNTHRIGVDPARSVIPIVVKSDALFSGGKPYILDDRSNVFGVNLYERFVGSQVTDGLSADLNNSLAEADKALAQIIGQIAGGVVR